MKTNVVIFIAGLLLLVNSKLIAQETKAFNVGADLVNRYIWRGLDLDGGDKSIHIQPMVSYTIKNFEIGAWGTYGLSNDVKEYDFFATYTFKDFGISFCNYNIPSDDPEASTSTGEFTLSYNGSEKIPFYASINQYVWNDDAMYIDCGVKLNTKHKLPMDLNIGFTPAQSFYANNAAFVNASYKIEYDIKFSDKVSLPVFGSVIANPYAKKTFVVVGMTFSTN